MAFNTLFRSGYQAFLDENRDDQDLWFFLHIPKTAGSSFRAELSSVLQPDYNIHAYDGADTKKDHGERLDAAVAAFAAALWRTPYRFVSGHVPVSRLGPIVGGARTPKTFTMLRDPVARMISDFRYQSTPEHPDHISFRERYPDIESYLAAPGECNKMTTYLAPAPDATADQTVAHVLNTFTFVGAMETYALSFRIMMELLKQERAPSVFLRKTEDAQATSVELTPALEVRIREANAKDVVLYETFMAKLRTVEDIMNAQSTPEFRAPSVGVSPWRTL